MPFVVECAPAKENLKMFGGTMSIEEYRQRFHIIRDYKWVEIYFCERSDLVSTKQSLEATKHRRLWAFHNYDGDQCVACVNAKEKQKQKEEESPPVIKKKHYPSLC